MQRMAGKRRFAELERREAGRADVSEIAKPASEGREGEMEGLLALSEELLSGLLPFLIRKPPR